MAAATIGLVADGRKLIEQARIEAQRHRLVYEEPITVKNLVYNMSSYMQIFTQYGGLRPFGVTLLVAGYDTEPRVFEIDPSGTPTEWKATAVGEGRESVMKILDARYEEGMDTRAAFSLGVEALKSFLKDKFEPERIEAATVTKEGFRKMTPEEVREIIHGEN